MIKHFLYILLAIITVACSKGNVNVSGSVNEGKIAEGDSIFMMATMPSGESRIIDRSLVKDGAFELSGDAQTPCMCSVVTFMPDGAVKDKIDFVADSSWVSIAVGLKRDVIDGSSLNDELQRVNDSLYLVKEIYSRYHNKKRDTPTLSQMGIKEADDVMAVTAVYSKGIITRAIERNANNKLAPYFIKKYNAIMSPEECVRMINNLPLREKQDVVIAYLYNLYNGVLNTAVGKPFVDFVQRGTDGKPCRFSDVAGKGKPVILSVWSSKIKASMSGQKALKELLERNSDKLLLVGLSLDTSYNIWSISIKENSIAGIQLTDLRGWQNAVLPLYGIDRCPYYILVDGDGVIRYRGDRVDDIEKLLK